MGRVDAFGVLGHGAVELRQAPGRRVRLLVDGGERLGIAEAKVGRGIDHGELDTGRIGGIEQPLDHAGRCAVRRRGEHDPVRRLAEPVDRGIERDEPRLGIARTQVGEALGEQAARPARRHGRAELELWVRSHETQHLPADVTGAAEDDDGPRAVHGAASAASCPRPIARCTKSPSSLPAVSALNALTPQRPSMISMPT